MTVTGSGFGMITSTGSGKDIDLKLQISSSSLTCQNVKLVSVSAGIAAITCMLPPFLNSAPTYTNAFSVRGFRVQPSVTASFVSP